MTSSSSSSWGARNLRKHPCTADSAELRRPAVPDDSPYQKAFDFGRSLLVCPKCNNQNTFIRNGNTKAGPAIKCNNSSCRHRIFGKSFFSFVNPLLSAARALNDTNTSAVPKPAVSIPSSPLPTSEQHVTIIQVPKQQWDALIKRCITLEDQVARLSERTAFSNTESVPKKHNEPSNRQASLCAPARKEGHQTTAIHRNITSALPSGLPQSTNVTAPAPSGSRSWAEIARFGTKPSLDELPEAYKSKLLKAKKLLRDAGYASLSTPSRSPPAMEARYFSGFKRGPYKLLISLLRNETRNRAVIAVSFIGKSILDIVTPKNEADRLFIGLEAIGYRHLSKFGPTKKAISTLKVMSAEERKRKNLELALSRYERAAQNCHSHWAAKWYKQQEKRIRDLILCESFESAMVIDSNAGEESSAPTPNANRSQLVGQNGIDKSPARQKDTIHHNATTVDASNTFAVLSPAENDAEPLDTAAGNNHMEVEEPLPVTNRTADQDNIDAKILQHISRQIPNHEPTKTVQNSSNTSSLTGNDTIDSDADSFGSDWDHDGAPTYDHELRRPK